MKTAIFIFDSIQQVVLTPESEIDKRVCELIEKGTTGTMRGSVYKTQGGWIRFEQAPRQFSWDRYCLDVQSQGMEDDQSLIIRVADKPLAPSVKDQLATGESQCPQESTVPESPPASP